MKILTTTAIILTLSLSGSAFAGDDFWDANYKLLLRNSNPMDESYVPSNNGRVGSESKSHDLTRHANFWNANYKLLLRNSNPNDDGYVAVNTSNIGGQPEIGSISDEHSLELHRNFWAENYKLLLRNSNPNDD
jgi:hypothetical protein